MNDNDFDFYGLEFQMNGGSGIDQIYRLWNDFGVDRRCRLGYLEANEHHILPNLINTAMKIIHLSKDNNQWTVKYDEESQTVTVTGPDPEGRQIYQWLTTSKHVIHQETGALISIIPTQNWTYM